MAETSHDGTSGAPRWRIIWRCVMTLIAVLLIQLLAFAVPRVVHWIEVVGLVAAIAYAIALALVAGFILTAIVGFSLARALVPQLTKYATPILFMLFVLLALLPGLLLQTRELARRQHAMYNLSKVGRKIHGHEQRAGHRLSPDELQLLLADPEFAPPGAGN